MKEILQYFQDLGYEDLYRSRIEPKRAAIAVGESSSESGQGEETESHRQSALLSLAEEASRCEKCALSQGRQTVVFGSGMLEMKDMVRTGIWMNLISIVILTIFVYFLLPLIWGFDMSTFPDALK